MRPAGTGAPTIIVLAVHPDAVPYRNRTTLALDVREKTHDRCDAEPALEETFRLMYRSRDLIPADRRKVELGLLFSEARSNNKQKGITGALLLSEDWFVQVLEGDEDAVRALFTSIEKDPRHDSVSVLETGMVARGCSPGGPWPRWPRTASRTSR